MLAEATTADYVRDPTRWGSAEVAALFPGFKHLDMRTKGAIIRLRHGGSGPPLLLLHGNPQQSRAWYASPHGLRSAITWCCADLRGYGDSSLPEPGPNHINYSFRVMAEDMIEVMDSLGHQRFFLAGHDRGARVSHRMCLDHPDRVMKVCLLDVLPNYHVWTNLNKNWAMNSWHWLFLAQPEPFPETLMSAVPAEWFLKSRRVRQAASQGRVRRLHPLLHQKDDHRLLPRLSRQRHDRFRDGHGRQGSPDRDAALGLVGNARARRRRRNIPTVWRKFASNLVDAQPLPTGHYLQEEAPDQRLRSFREVLHGVAASFVSMSRERRMVVRRQCGA